MKNNYILIDFENVHPKSLEILNGHPFKVIVFVGANQAKVPLELVMSMQAWVTTRSTCRSQEMGQTHWIFTSPSISAN